MPVVTGNLLDITGSDLAGNIAQLVFRLNSPNVTAAGIDAGKVYPTKEKVVTPSSTGEFSVPLAATSGMFWDAWYEVGIRWNESSATFWDFGLRIEVTAGGPHNFASLLTGGSGGRNQLLVWVSETPPKSPGRGQWWFQPSTNNLYRWE